MLDFSLYAAILLDLDGTLYHEEHVLPGAVDFVERLQKSGHPYACLSNSTDSPQRVTARLERMGIAIDPGHIFTAAAAAAEFVMKTPHSAPIEGDAFARRKPRIFNLASHGVQEMLDGRVDWVAEATQPCDAIIVGTPTNPHATPERQRIALHLLRDRCALVGICADRIFPSPRGIEFGSGALTTFLGYAADVQPVFVGKPEKVFFQQLGDRLGVDPARCVLIGDNLESDIQGGNGIGMKTILTLSGVTRRRDLSDLPASQNPARVIKDLSELL